jgi:hypothetical protein
MNIYEIVFFVSLFGCMGIFFYKLYNLLNGGRVYSLQAAIVTLVAYLVFFGLGLVTFILDYTTTLYRAVFMFEALFLVIVVLMFIIELLFVARDAAQGYTDTYSGYAKAKVIKW